MTTLEIVWRTTVPSANVAGPSRSSKLSILDIELGNLAGIITITLPLDSQGPAAVAAE